MADDYKPWTAYQDPDTKAYMYFDPSKASWQNVPQEFGKDDAGAKQFVTGMQNYTAQASKAMGGQRVEVQQPPAGDTAAATLNMVKNPPAAAPSLTGTKSESIPAQIKRTMVDTLNEHGHTTTAKVLDYMVPSSYPEIAALAATGLIPGYGEMGLLSKIAYPTIAAGTAGALHGDSVAGSAATGALTGVGAKVGETGVNLLNRAARSSGMYEIGPKLYSKFDEKFSGPLGDAIKASLPILKNAGVTIKNAMDIRSLFEDGVQKKVGAQFGGVENKVAQAMKGRLVDMPVNLGVVSPAGERQAVSGSNYVIFRKMDIHTALEHLKHLRDLQAKSSAKQEDKALYRQAEDALLQQLRGNPIAEPTARAQSAQFFSSPGVAKPTPGAGVTEADIVADPHALPFMSREVGPAAARDVGKAGVPLGKDLPSTLLRQKGSGPGTAEDLAKRNKIADEFEAIRNEYRKWMRFKETYEGKLGRILPGGDKGKGLDILSFGNELHNNPEMSQEDFRPLFKFFEGEGGPGAQPIKDEIQQIGVSTHVPGLPIHAFMHRSGKVPVANLTQVPALRAAMEKYPALSRILDEYIAKALTTGRLVGGAAGGSFGPE